MVLTAVAALCLAISGRAEEMDMSQRIVNPAFKTLKVTLEGNEFAPPVIRLDDPASRVTVSFDEISEDRRYMRYELIHCDAY